MAVAVAGQSQSSNNNTLTSQSAVPLFPSTAACSVQSSGKSASHRLHAMRACSCGEDHSQLLSAAGPDRCLLVVY